VEINFVFAKQLTMKIFHSESISEFSEIFLNKHPVIFIIAHRPPSHGKPWKGPDHGINQPKKSNVDLIGMVALFSKTLFGLFTFYVYKRIKSILREDGIWH